jgi:PHS family inorganic phosphate transporter-like MFS transporter
MISSVFMMQPIGQALAQLVGLWVLLGRQREYNINELQCGLNTAHEEKCKEIIDGIWRIVVGSGAVPALLAIIFRFFLFDCGLYSLEVKNKPDVALKNTQRVYGTVPSSVYSGGFPVHQSNGAIPHPDGSHQMTQLGQQQEQPAMPIQFSKADLHKYFIEEGNWYYLLGKKPQLYSLLSLGIFWGSTVSPRHTIRIPQRTTLVSDSH